MSSDSSDPKPDSQTQSQADAAAATELAQQEGAEAAAEENFELANHTPAADAAAPVAQDAVMVESEEEKEAWWERLLGFLGTSSSAIIGLGVVALAGYFLVISIWKPLPEYEANWVAFLGRFHVLVLHLPIGGVAYLLFVEFCRRFQIFKKRKNKVQRVPVLLFTAATAVMAAGLGYLLAVTGTYSDNQYLQEHLLSGLFFTLATGLSLFFGALLAQWKTFFSRMGYLLSLILVVFSVTVAGHGGGNIVRGEKYLFDKAPEFLRGPLERLGVEFTEEVELIDPDKAAAIPAEQRQIFAEVISPVLQVHCVKCHGSDQSYGGSRMDSYELLMKGGGFGPGVIAGDPDNSLIIKRMELPQSNAEFMPPLKGGVPLPSEETILLLREWIALGAPETGKLGDFEFSEKALSAVPELDDSGDAPKPEMTQEQKDAQAAEEFARAQLELREQLEPVVEQLGAELGTSSLLFTSRETPQLSFNGFSLGYNLTGEMLSSLAPVASELVELNLRATALDDAMAASLPEDMPKLEVVDVAQTQLTEQGLAEIVRRAPVLRRLVAYETEVGDAVFASLLERSDLEFLSFKTTPITEAGVAEFSGQRPEVKVLYEPLAPNPEAAAIKQREAEEFARGERK